MIVMFLRAIVMALVSAMITARFLLIDLNDSTQENDGLVSSVAARSGGHCCDSTCCNIKECERHGWPYCKGGCAIL